MSHNIEDLISTVLNGEHEESIMHFMDALSANGLDPFFALMERQDEEFARREANDDPDLGPILTHVTGEEMMQIFGVGDSQETLPTGRGSSQSTAPVDTTYDRLTEGRVESRRRNPRIAFGQGYAAHHHPARSSARYQPAREAPLTSQEMCRCEHFNYEHAPHRLDDPAFHNLHSASSYVQANRDRVRRQALGGMGPFGSMSNRELVETRQARSLAGLDVSEYDRDITRRILADPSAWGRIGSVMRSQGYDEEVFRLGRDYRLH